MTEDMSDNLKDALSQISGLTSDLLDAGQDSAQVAWALTTIATDMSLQVCSDPLRVMSVLLNAITMEANRHLEVQDAAESTEETKNELVSAPAGALLH